MKIRLQNLLKKIILISMISLLSFSAFAASSEENDSDPESWQVTSFSGKNKVQINKKTVSFNSCDEAIAYWIYNEIKEGSKLCISRNKVFVTAKPSVYYKKNYESISNQFLSDRESTISAFNISKNPKIEAAFEKQLSKSNKKSSDVEKKSDKNHVTLEFDEPAPEETIETPAVQNEPEENEIPENTTSEVPENIESDNTQEEEQATEIENQITEPDVTVVEEVEAPSVEPELPVAETVEAAIVAVEAAAEIPAVEEEAAPEIENQENIAVEEEKQPEVEEPKKQIKRYKKEYLQDFMPDDVELPENQQKSLKSTISNPNEMDGNQVTLLMKAAKAGNDWEIKELLSAGADINLKDKDGWSALMYAVRYQENINTVQLLLDGKSDIKTKNKFDTSALVIAAVYNNNPAIIEKLLTYYSPSEREVVKAFDLLLSSVQSSEFTQIAKINVFLQKDISINSYFDGKTPLMYAAQFGNSTSVLKLLVDNDALTNLRSTEGKTAFDYAVENSSLKHDENFWLLNKK